MISEIVKSEHDATYYFLTQDGEGGATGVVARGDLVKYAYKQQERVKELKSALEETKDYLGMVCGTYLPAAKLEEAFEWAGKIEKALEDKS